MAEVRNASSEPVNVTFENVNISFADNHVIKDVSLRIEPESVATVHASGRSGEIETSSTPSEDFTWGIPVQTIFQYRFLLPFGGSSRVVWRILG